MQISRTNRLCAYDAQFSHRALCVYCISVWVTILSISKGILGETCKTILILHVEINEFSIKSHHDQPVNSRSFGLGLCVLGNHVTENQLVQTSFPIMALCEQTLLLPPALLCDLTLSHWWINWMQFHSVPHTQSAQLPAYKWTGMNGHGTLRETLAVVSGERVAVWEVCAE